MTDTKRSLSVVLHFSEGSSDKTYQAQVKAKDDGFVVEFQYGRRGGPLQSGCKTPKPVAFEAAEKVFAKLVAEKKAKGYTEAESGVAYQDTSNQHRVSGFLPQLLNPIDEEIAKGIFIDSSWCMQQKYDGVRCLLRVFGGDITGINRKGLTVPLPQAVVNAAYGLPGGNDVVLDGELVGETLFVWDILRHDGVDTTNLPLSVRLAMLDPFPDTGALRRIATYKTREEKAQAYEQLRADGVEGVVMKKLASPYRAGRPNSLGDALKLKFVATASFIVSRTLEGKRSVGMAMLDAAGKQVDVGNVSIPINHDLPSVGTVCEVRYLYAFRGGALFQPVYLGTRHDIDVSDCMLDQLQYKNEAVAA